MSTAQSGVTRKKFAVLGGGVSMKELGWEFDLALMETYAPIFNAGLDMTDLLPRETWEGVPPSETAQACYYFTGDVENEKEEDALVRGDTVLER